jgi:uncharacterized Zn ribbon protein
MKKNFLLAVAVLAAIGYGCSNEDWLGTRTVNGNDIIVASLDDSGTRTSLDQNTPSKVLWNDQDAISVFASNSSNTSNVEYKLSNGANTSSAEFTGSLSTGYSKVAVLYPYKSSATYDATSKKISYTLSASAYKYDASNPTLTNEAPMAALYSEGSSEVNFKHAGAVIDLTIKNVPAGYTSATLTSGTSDNVSTAAKVAGSAEITFDDSGNPTLAIASTDNGSATEATVNFESSDKAQDIRLIFPLPVTTYGKLELTLNGEGKSKIFVTSWSDVKATRAKRLYKTKTVDSVTGSVQAEASSASEATSALQNTTAVVLDLSASTEDNSKATITLPDVSSTSSDDTNTNSSTPSISTPVSITLNNVSASHDIEITEPTSSTNSSVKTSEEVTVAASTTSENTEIKSLTINLPSSTVTLTAANAGSQVKYKDVTASTSENTLKVGESITISTLKVKKGNIYIKNGASITTIQRETGNQDTKTRVVIESGATVANLSSLKSDTSFSILEVTDENDFQTALLQEFLNGNTNENIFKLTKDMVLSRMLLASAERTLDLNGHSMKPAETFDYATISEAAKATTNDALIAVRRGGKLTIKDSSSNNSGSIDANNTVMCALKMTIAEDEDDTSLKDKTASLIVEGGTIKGKSYAITGHMNRHNTEVSINGGNLQTYTTTSGCAIFQPQNGTLTITDGTIKGSTGVEVRAGNVTITGGSLEGLTTASNCAASATGMTSKGMGLCIAQHTTKLPIDVKISGGTFNGKYAFYEQDIQKNNAGNQTISITGGVFETMVASTTYKNKSFITGGTFNSLTTALKYAYGTTDNPAKISVSKDLEFTSSVAFSKAINLEIDLGGHTLTLASTSKIELADKNYKLLIKNGKFECPIGSAGLKDGPVFNLVRGTFEFDNLTIQTTKYYTVMYGQSSNVKVTMKNSSLTGVYYSYSSNASDTTNGVEANFEQTTFNSPQTGFMMNVPCNVTFDGCTFQGNHQGALLRGGTYTFKGNNLLTLSAEYDTSTDDCHNGSAWGEGNQTAFGALVIGNNPESTAYQYPTTVTFASGTTTVKRTGTYASSYPDVFVTANSSTNNVTITGFGNYVKNESSSTPEVVYYTDNITVDGTAKSAADNASASN